MLQPEAGTTLYKKKSVDRKSDLPLGVTEDDSLGDGQSVVQVTESVKLPLLPLHRYEELLDPLQSQLVTEREGPSRVSERP